MERIYRWFCIVRVKMSGRRVLLPVCFLTVSLMLYIAFTNTKEPETAQTMTFIMQQARIASGLGSRSINNSRPITLRQGNFRKSEEETFNLGKCKTPKKDLCYKWGEFDRLSSSGPRNNSWSALSLNCTKSNERIKNFDKILKGQYLISYRIIEVHVGQRNFLMTKPKFTVKVNGQQLGGPVDKELRLQTRN